MAKNIIEQFVEALTPKDQKQNHNYSAEVSRIDNEGVVWVYLAGSDKETPTALSSAEVKKGDVVNVEWRNNKLYIEGNTTDLPPSTTKMKTVEIATQTARDAAARAVSDAAVAKAAADTATEAANTATEAIVSVVDGAQTVEKAVSVMQTALEAVVDYDPDNDTVQEYFWHDANGAHVLGDTSGYRNDISSSGMKIVTVSDEKAVAEFGAGGAVIGRNDGSQSYLREDYHSLQMIDKEGSVYFNVSDLRDSSGYAEITEGFLVKKNATYIDVSLPVDSPTGYAPVITDGITNYQYTVSGRRFTLAQPVPYDMSVSVTYKTADDGAKAFTVGTRSIYENVGPYSFAIGKNVTASAPYSYADGLLTKSSGWASHSEGYNSTASDQFSHAEGYHTTASGYASHSEGYETVAGEAYAHAEGYYSEATGFYSHASGKGAKASSDGQTAIGKYNEEDANDKYALIIGNGSGDTNRANVFMVDWNGDIYPQATKMSDYVVAQGIDGNWTYRNGHSGIAECWGRHTATLSNYATANGFYGYHTTFSLPSNLFVSGSVPTHTYTVSIGTAFAMPASGISSSNTDIHVYGLTNVSGSQSCVFDIVVKGRWK